MREASPLCLFLLLSLSFLVSGDARAQGDPNYRDALAKSLLFFQGQRSGNLPATQQIRWRSNSGLSDGLLANVNLTGGYYDAGDNVKFNFPMAFTTTVLSWGTKEFGRRMGRFQLAEARDAIRWATDYLLKCATATPGKLYVGVGDPNADHQCWERPEDMDTVRSVYSVSSSNPGSDVAGETAAALAAASMVFKVVDPKYSSLLLETARKVLQFAIDNKGAYSDSLGSAVCPFYCSYSGYEDELFWGAAWLFKATEEDSYYNLLNSVASASKLGVFSWDNKHAGALVLLTRRLLVGHDNRFEQIKGEAEEFICNILPNSPSTTTKYTKGGLMFNEMAPDVNLQYVTTATFLLTTYAKYMRAARHTFSCGSLLVKPNNLIALAKRQVDYILGVNPMNMSYMAGFGPNYPQKIHHRGSSLPTLASHPQHMGCDDGYSTYYSSPNPNPNILTGAIVGGPNENDEFSDDRTDHSHTEPATYINGAIVGPLAYFARSF